MNSEFDKWSKDALTIMKNFNEENSKEHENIINIINLLRKSLNKTNTIVLIFGALMICLILYEIYELFG